MLGVSQVSKLLLFLTSALSVVSLLFGAAWAVLIFVSWDKAPDPQEQTVSIVAAVAFMVSPLMAGLAQEMSCRGWLYPSRVMAIFASLPIIWLAGALLLAWWDHSGIF